MSIMVGQRQVGAGGQLWRPPLVLAAAMPLIFPIRCRLTMQRSDAARGACTVRSTSVVSRIAGIDQHQLPVGGRLALHARCPEICCRELRLVCCTAAFKMLIAGLLLALLPGRPARWVSSVFALGGQGTRPFLPKNRRLKETRLPGPPSHRRPVPSSGCAHSRTVFLWMRFVFTRPHECVATFIGGFSFRSLKRKVSEETLNIFKQY